MTRLSRQHARAAHELTTRAIAAGGRLQAQAYHVAFLILSGRKPVMVFPDPNARLRFRRAVATALKALRRTRRA